MTAIVNQGRLDPIAYSYEAAHHCPVCTARRFGVDNDGWIPESATDGEGNPVRILTLWDEWYDAESDEPQTLVCDDCGGTIDEYEGSRR